MSNDLTVISHPKQKQLDFTEEQKSVLKNTIAKDATDAEFKLFVWQCERTGLDPFSKQIYFIKSGGKVQIQTSIDGFRVIAERSGLYEGQTPAQWCGPDGVWKELWTSDSFPTAARIGVYKKGFREPLYAIAHWNEYFSAPGFMHKKMPALMLAKVAESLALRKAFPNDMEGLYTQEEMGKEPAEEKTEARKDENVIEVTDYKKGVFPDQPAPDEGDPNQSWGYVIPFGQYRNKTLEQVGPEKLKSYIEYLEREAAKQGKALGGRVAEFVEIATEFITSFESSPIEEFKEDDMPY